MANPGKREEDINNYLDRSDGRDSDDYSSADGSGASSRGSRDRSEAAGGIGLTERLTEVFVDRGDADLLLQHNNHEDGVLQWLDMQVIGACRADERLTPLLKLNAPGGAAEDRLLAHLSQHFEPSEVGMLARCFCLPLVSIRVGKINKQGTLLCPSSARGNLNLTLLPTSDLCLSFVGDDGQMERIVTLNNSGEISTVAVEELLEDASGRSFLLKIPDGREFFFWCSEKSKLLGVELLRKMKDLLKRRPSVAELTGINDSRLDCFVTYLRAYLVGSAVSNGRASVSGSPAVSAASISKNHGVQGNSNTTSASASKLTLPQHGSSNQAWKPSSSHLASLSPKVSSFKEGLPRSSLSLRSAREKLKKRVESPLTIAENLPVTSPFVLETPTSEFQDSSKVQGINSCPFSGGLLESLGKLTMSPNFSPISQVPCSTQPIFSPYYCWCPPSIPERPTPLNVSQTNFPPLPSSLLLPTTTLNLSDLPSLELPTFLPDPLVRLPKSASHPQIPTFTPLICDPIVHIPIINICSAGQGYLVSAGPTVTTTIPPLHPKLVNPLIPEPDSMVEEGARETLRLLLSGSSALPAVLASAGEKQIGLVAGSRGLYTGTQEVSAVGLISLPGITGSGTVGRVYMLDALADKCGTGSVDVESTFIVRCDDDEAVRDDDSTD